MLKIIYKFLLFYCFSHIAVAESSITVEALQSPAWKENASGLVALKPGMRLQKNDRIKTGDTAKVVLRLSEGSHIKLGEKSIFMLNTLSNEQTESVKQQDSVFKAAVQVLTGAFRFTTSKLGKLNKRNIDIQLVTATVGIRGTDVWGRATPEQDFICLLEGKIAIQREKEAEVVMSKPLSLYVADTEQAAKPLDIADEETVKALALETDLDQGRGVITETGQYVVYLLSSQNRNGIVNMQTRLAELGYAADVLETSINDKVWYRLAVKNFLSINDARYFAEKANTSLGANKAWVAKI